MTPFEHEDPEPQWLASSDAGALNGRLGEFQQLLSLLDARPSVLAVAAAPMSGTSAVLAQAASQFADVVAVDARGCGDEIDLAMAIAAAVVAEYHPKAYPWWVGRKPLFAADEVALEMMRDLRELSGFGVDIEGLRSGDGDPLDLLDGALRVTASRTRNPVTLILDHFGLLAHSLGSKRTRAVLATLRAVIQEAGNVGVVIVEFVGGPTAAGLEDPSHPLFHFGRVLEMPRAQPREIAESLMVTRPWTSVRADLLRAAAELAAGVPGLTWRIVQLADWTGDDGEGPPEVQTVAYRAWRALRHYTEPETARQWDMLRAVHPRAQWVLAAIATGGRPHDVPANPKSIHAALAALRDLGIAFQPASRSWAVADPLLAAWARDHSQTRGRSVLRIDNEEPETMTPANKRTVTPHDRGWSVEKPGASRASSVHDTQAAAIAAARKNLQSSGGGELAIKGRDGAVRDQNTIAPGNDPRSSRG